VRDRIQRAFRSRAIQDSVFKTRIRTKLIDEIHRWDPMRFVKKKLNLYLAVEWRWGGSGQGLSEKY
jgi:hypothetical protein